MSTRLNAAPALSMGPISQPPGRSSSRARPSISVEVEISTMTWKVAPGRTAGVEIIRVASTTASETVTVRLIVSVAPWSSVTVRETA